MPMAIRLSERLSNLLAAKPKNEGTGVEHCPKLIPCPFPISAGEFAITTQEDIEGLDLQIKAQEYGRAQI